MSKVQIGDVFQAGNNTYTVVEVAGRRATVRYGNANREWHGYSGNVVGASAEEVTIASLLKMDRVK